MFGNIFNSIRNLFGGGRDEEEEKRKLQTPRPVATVAPPRSLMPQSNPRPETPGVSVPLMPSIINKPPVQGDVSDLDEGQQRVVNRLRSEGKDNQANEIVAASRNYAAAKKESDWNNSFLGKASGFVAGLPKATYDVVSEGVQDLGRGVGTAAAFNSQAVKDADEARQRGIQLQNDINENISSRLRDPNVDDATKSRLRGVQIANIRPNAAKQSYDDLYAEMAGNTDPLKIVMGALDTATLPLVGGLAAAKAVPKAVMTAADTFVDPLNLLNRVPVNSRLGRVLNADLNPFKGIPDLTDLAPTPPAKRPATDPTSSISAPAPTAPKPPAITSPNRPTGIAPAPAPAPMPLPPQAMPSVAPAPALDVPAPITQPLVPEQPLLEEVLPTQPEIPVPEPPMAQAVETPLQAQSRVVATQTTPVSPQAIAEAEAILDDIQTPSRTAALDVPEGAVVESSDGLDPLDELQSTRRRIIQDQREGRLTQSQADDISQEAIERYRRRSTPSEQRVITRVDGATGDKTFYRPKSDEEYIRLNEQIDRTEGGNRGDDDSVVHVTAGSTDELGDRGFAEVDSLPDSRLKGDAPSTPVARADAKADRHLTAAKEAGVDYGDLVVKTTRNWDSMREGGLPDDLTPAERTVWEGIYDDLQAVTEKRNKLGISDEDMGWIADSEYLPTGLKDDLNLVESTSDAMRSDIGFAQKREGKLDDTQVKEGAEQALRNYLRVGELLDDLTPEQIDSIKIDGINNRTTELVENDALKQAKVFRTDEEINQSRQATDRIISAERQLRDFDKSDSTDIGSRTKIIDEIEEARLQKKVDDLLMVRKKTKEAIEKVKNSDIDREGKRQRIKALEDAADNVEYQTRYLQTYTRSNVLLQVPGRVADQANKAAQAMGDMTTGVLGRLAEDKTFQQYIGRGTRGDSATVKQVMGNLKGDQRLRPGKHNTRINKMILESEGKTGAGKLVDRYRIGATTATEWGSRTNRPVKDAVSFFVAKANAEGVTDINEVTKYVQDAVGKAEWKRVYGEFYDMRNKFTGITAHQRSVDGLTVKEPGVLEKAFSGLDRFIESAVGRTGVSRRAQREIADAIRIPVVGFPRLMLNLGNTGLNHATFGVRDLYKASKIVPKDEASALRKALLMRSAVESAQTGATVGAMGAMLSAGGMVSGAYPEDASERRRWEAEGKQPYSIKMTGPDGKDHWFDISRYIGPYAFPFLLGAQASQGNFSPKEVAAMTGNIAKQVSQNYGTESVGDFLDIASQLLKGDFGGAGSDLQRYLPNMISMGIPFSGQLNATGRMTDDTQRSTEGDGLFDTIRRGIQRKIPGLRDNLEAKTDAFGKPLAEDPLGAFLPTYGGNQDASDPIRTELSRLAEAGVEAYPGGVSGNSRNYSLKDAEGKAISLTSKQQSDLNNAVKEEKAHQAELIMDSPTYASASDQEKGEMLKKLYSLDSTGVASQWAKANDVAGVKNDVEGINNSIDRTLQQALVEAKLQGDKKDAWLDDIDNAANYYKADYKNAEANGTLDYDDKHLDKKSSKRYKMVAAETNKEFGADRDIIALYENTNKTEFKNMPAGEMKNRLLAFDLARAKKGVSLHSSDHKKGKYGYNLDGSLAGGGGGRGKRTVSLPSIRGAVGGSGSSRKYAEGGKLYKPQLALEVPRSSATTKTPTISVKRGVHL